MIQKIAIVFTILGLFVAFQNFGPAEVPLDDSQANVDVENSEVQVNLKAKRKKTKPAGQLNRRGNCCKAD